MRENTDEPIDTLNHQLKMRINATVPWIMGWVLPVPNPPVIIRKIVSMRRPQKVRLRRPTFSMIAAAIRLPTMDRTGWAI
jgi:hypothetical protein